jgi:hypothetical protein
MSPESEILTYLQIALMYLVVFVPAGLVYLTATVLFGSMVRLYWREAPARQLAYAVGMSVSFLAATTVVYALAAFWLRSSALSGPGGPIDSGALYGVWIPSLWAGAQLVVLLFSVNVGLGASPLAGRLAWGLAMATMVATLGFMLVTLPVLDRLNGCIARGPVLTGQVPHC